MILDFFTFSLAGVVNSMLWPGLALIAFALFLIYYIRKDKERPVSIFKTAAIGLDFGSLMARQISQTLNAVSEC